MKSRQDNKARNPIQDTVSKNQLKKKVRGGEEERKKQRRKERNSCSCIRGQAYHPKLWQAWKLCKDPLSKTKKGALFWTSKLDVKITYSKRRNDLITFIKVFGRRGCFDFSFFFFFLSLCLTSAEMISTEDEVLTVERTSSF